MLPQKKKIYTAIGDFNQNRSESTYFIFFMIYSNIINNRFDSRVTAKLESLPTYFFLVIGASTSESQKKISWLLLFSTFANFLTVFAQKVPKSCIYCKNKTSKRFMIFVQNINVTWLISIKLIVIQLKIA